MSFLKIIKKIIKRPYYYVSPCPVCKSRMTGRYIRLWRDTEAQWQINESLRNGELVRPVAELLPRNCFCADCDYEWWENVELQFFSLEQIDEEKKARLTREILNERINEQRDFDRNDHRPFKSIRNFIGKI